jgi:hypothetical protein
MQRLKRVFAMPQGTLSWCFASIHLVDIETCPDRGGMLRVIACIEEPALIARILGHVQQCLESDNKLARAPPGHQEQTFKLIWCPVGGQSRGGFGCDPGIE